MKYKYSFFFFFLFISLYILLGCGGNKSEKKFDKLNSINLFENVNKIRENQLQHNYEQECFLPKFTLEGENNDINLIYQRAECHIDTFDINSNRTILELKNAIKSYFKIDRKAKIYYRYLGETVYDKIEIDSFKILSRDILIRTKSPILDTLKIRKSAGGFLISSFVQHILEKIQKQLLEKKINTEIYFGYMETATDYTSVSYIKDKDSKLNEEYWIQNCLNKIGFSHNKIPVFLRDKYNSFILDKKTMSLKTCDISVTILGDEKQTLKEAGLTNLDVVHYFTINFIVFYKK